VKVSSSRSKKETSPDLFEAGFSFDTVSLPINKTIERNGEFESRDRALRVDTVRVERDESFVKSDR